MYDYSRFPYEKACPATRAIYDDIMDVLDISDREQIPSWALFIGEFPDKLAKKWSLIKSSIFENSLSPILRELLMVCISRSANSPYCEARHSYELMKMTNLGYEEVAYIIDGQSNAIIPDRYLHGVKVAKAILNSSCEQSEEHFNHLMASGFSSTEATEIMELMSAGIYISFYTKCLNIPLDKEIQAFLKKQKGVGFTEENDTDQ